MAVPGQLVVLVGCSAGPWFSLGLHLTNSIKTDEVYCFLHTIYLKVQGRGRAGSTKGEYTKKKSDSMQHPEQSPGKKITSSFVGLGPWEASASQSLG